MLLHHRFILSAKQRPGKLAFIDTTTGRRVTYSKALIGSLLLAKKFDSFDKGFIGIMLPTSAGCGLSVVASLMSGRTPVMINYSTGACRNAVYAQKKCGFRTIITSRAFLERLNCQASEGMVFIEDIMDSITSGERILAALNSALPSALLLRRAPAPDEDGPAVVLFTSGSEKDPKAVQLTHRNISSNIDSFSSLVDISEKDTILANLPYFHVFGLTVTLWTPLLLGMTIVSHANPLDYRTICGIVREHRPTIMVGTPNFLQGYLRKSEPGDFDSLRLVICGADKCPEGLRQGFTEKHGLVVYEGYGTTETSPVISVNTPFHNRPGSVGKTLPGVRVRIEDLDSGLECPAGVTGRIMVKGDLVMKGYYDDPAETAASIRDGWYDTGDLGYLDDDGYLWHAGRMKRFVKIAGEMISLVMVENVLEKFMPEDVSCCVVELPDPVKGSRIVAAVTRHLDEKLLLARMSQHLPNMALPRLFVVIEEMPRMGSGKIDFRGVTELVRQKVDSIAALQQPETS